jgi:hypothetical protein
MCSIKMQPQRDMPLISDEQKIIRYVTTTKVKEINNKRDIFDRQKTEDFTVWVSKKEEIVVAL